MATPSPNGLEIRQIRVPFGVIAMIYEARPNVTVDAAGLALKSGNAALLRGSASAYQSNLALVEVLAAAAEKAGLPRDAVQLVPGTDRASVSHLLRARGLVDLIIPRGGAGLISYVVENATVPVIETGVGNVHVYVDAIADLDMAERIVVNSKTSRVSVCNSAETLLVHARSRTNSCLGSRRAADAAEWSCTATSSSRAAGRASCGDRRRLGDRVPVPRHRCAGGGRRRRGDRPHPALVIGSYRGDRDAATSTPPIGSSRVSIRPR